MDVLPSSWRMKVARPIPLIHEGFPMGSMRASQWDHREDDWDSPFYRGQYCVIMLAGLRSVFNVTKQIARNSSVKWTARNSLFFMPEDCASLHS